jgi:hypothetical protein
LVGKWGVNDHVGENFDLVAYAHCAGRSIRACLGGGFARERRSPFLLYAKWRSEYTKIDGGTRFDYQSIGGSGGIKPISAHEVDFGASDKYLF